MLSSSGDLDAQLGFIKLFQGNRDVYGTETGGCVRTDGFDFLEKYIEWHLTGQGGPIGVYPMVLLPHPNSAIAMNWTVHWGCIDFDEGEDESLIHARNVERLCEALDVKVWIERSRSKGYHVWCFAKNWVPAELMREALLAVCQLVEAPTKEINPKQTTLPENSVGNYVRLPYPGVQRAHQLSTSGRRVMIDKDGHHIYLERFVAEALESRITAMGLEKLQSLYLPPPPRVIRRDWSNLMLDGTVLERLKGKARMIFEDGPLEAGRFRGHTLYKLACFLHEDGRHTREEALELLRDADQRWGKFHDRPDCEKRLTDTLERAWSAS